MPVPFKKSYFSEEIIQLGSDPAANAAYRVTHGSLWLNTTTDLLYERNDTNTGWEPVGGGSAGLGEFQDEFVTTQGQTSFILTHTPLNLASITVTLNQVLQDKSNLLGLTGKTLTVSGGLNAGDKIWFRYLRMD